MLLVPDALLNMLVALSLHHGEIDSLGTGRGNMFAEV